jgi:hypothetical protein
MGFSLLLLEPGDDVAFGSSFLRNERKGVENKYLNRSLRPFLVEKSMSWRMNPSRGGEFLKGFSSLDGGRG